AASEVLAREHGEPEQGGPAVTEQEDGEDGFLSPHVQQQFIRDQLQRHGVDLTDETPGNVLTEISDMRNRMIRQPEQYQPQSVPKDVFVTIARAYHAWKRKTRRMDHDDILVRLHTWLH